jgi:hypothetical protein
VLRHANGIEVNLLALGRLSVVGIFVVEQVWIGCLGLGRVEEGIVPYTVAGPRVVDDVVGAALEEVADREIEREVICLRWSEKLASADAEPVNSAVPLSRSWSIRIPNRRRRRRAACSAAAAWMGPSRVLPNVVLALDSLLLCRGSARRGSVVHSRVFDKGLP